jgi:putative tryptophan/tyrosine transport system substrate-binding protein
MRRREFIKLIGGASAAWPLAAGAQQAAVPVVGFLGSGSSAGFAPNVTAVRQGLDQAGYVEGRKVAIEYRWAEGQYDRLPALAADLVRRQVSAIVAPVSTPAALAAKAATVSIPIVFSIGGDPVELGLVASLNRPGGNVTGVTWRSTELIAKGLELIVELAPASAPIAAIVNPGNPNSEVQSRDLHSAGRALGRKVRVLNAGTERDIDSAFATLAHEGAGALLVGPDGFFYNRRDQIVALASRYVVPTLYSWPEYVRAGGLMSYGSSVSDANRLVGVYAGQILKGVKPADLPVVQSTKVELVINMKTVKALGLTLPPTLLARADEVIE